jgi:hypothetical protein
MLSTPVHSFSQPFLVEQLETIEEVLGEKTFLEEGWRSLSERFGLDEEFSTFLIRCCTAAVDRNRKAALFIYKSKNRKPLGFMLVEDDGNGCLLIYAAYSNGKYQGAPIAAMTFLRNWAKLAGYARIRLLSRRLNGAAMRLFRKKLGFRPVGVLFEQEI